MRWNCLLQAGRGGQLQPRAPGLGELQETFDVDNYSKAGDRVLVYTKKGADGKLVGQDTTFQ